MLPSSLQSAELSLQCANDYGYGSPSRGAHAGEASEVQQEAGAMTAQSLAALLALLLALAARTVGGCIACTPTVDTACLATLAIQAQKLVSFARGLAACCMPQEGRTCARAVHASALAQCPSDGLLGLQEG